VTDFFFYGTLCHVPLLRAVLGHEPVAEPAVLPGHSAYLVAGAAFPMISEGGAGAPGVLVRGLSDTDVARLDFYEGGFAYATREVQVTAGGHTAKARVYFPEGEAWQPGATWDLAAWAARWGDTVVAAAGDFMRHFGRSDPAAVLARYPLLLIRGGARVRAATTAATTLRRRAEPGDVVEVEVRQPYAKYFAVEEFDLKHRRFDGTMSEVLNRAVFISGDAAVVLPYDPARDRVLVIEQFRSGPHARGDRQPWLIEAVAGRVDGGETPEDAARREAREEAGLELRDLLPVAEYYPSPAAKAEYLYTYVGIADLPDVAPRIGGVPGEDEDIRAHVIDFERLTWLMQHGEITNAPLIILAMWLDRHRDNLRAAATGA
jgi:nudix-type nucleoside diphosphatase (YffH/AdpP family)